MRVAVVWNSGHSSVINQFGQTSPERYGIKTIERVVHALQQNGHEVVVCEADLGLFQSLLRFMPPDAEGRPTGMVFNMAYGIQGECRYTHVPAMLELAGVPYTGSGPLGHTLALDKVITKQLIRDAGVPTPAFRVMRSGQEDASGLRFPVVVKPRHESTSFGLQMVSDPARLRTAVEAIVSTYSQDALVEEYIDGREICVSLLGNDDPQLLPLVEQDFGQRESRLITWEDKTHRSVAEPQKICPAFVDELLRESLQRMSIATFRACHCRDFARVDFRMDREGRPYVLEINSMAALGMGASYVLAAKTSGMEFSALVNHILHVARHRYGLETAESGAFRTSPIEESHFNGIRSQSSAARLS